MIFYFCKVVSASSCCSYDIFHTYQVSDEGGISRSCNLIWVWLQVKRGLHFCCTSVSDLLHITLRNCVIYLSLMSSTYSRLCGIWLLWKWSRTYPFPDFKSVTVSSTPIFSFLLSRYWFLLSVTTSQRPYKWPQLCFSAASVDIQSWCRWKMLLHTNTCKHTAHPRRTDVSNMYWNLSGTKSFWVSSFFVVKWLEMELKSRD